MEYVTAPTYRNWERVGSPYENNGKMYTKVKTKCDRCVNGVYVCRIENGQPVPHPNCGGVCFECGGAGFLTKDVRLYSVAEAEKMRQRNEAARIKRQNESEEKRLAAAEKTKAAWLERNGFNKEGYTFVVTGESYSIKDDLKSAGYHFCSILKWHKAEDLGDFSDRVVKIEVSEVAEFNKYGEGHFKTGALEYIENIINPKEPSNSEWVGTEGERMTFENVVLERKSSFEGRFGYSNVYTFKAGENILTWFSTVDIEKEVGDTFTLVGTVKNHTEYKDVKQTVLTRCKIK